MGLMKTITDREAAIALAESSPASTRESGPSIHKHPADQAVSSRRIGIDKPSFTVDPIPSSEMIRSSHSLAAVPKLANQGDDHPDQNDVSESEENREPGNGLVVPLHGFH